MTWTLAPALETFLREINATWPNRPKTSDGTVGDSEHAARKSEHNPNRDPDDTVPENMVTAVDVTKMSAAGIERIRKAAIADPRTWYVIHAGKIWSRTHDFKPRPYVGENAHEKHLHLSLVQTAKACRDGGPWGIVKGVKAVSRPGPAPDQPKAKAPATIQRGSKGELVSAIQGFLGIEPVTGHFGPLTMAQVKRYQRQHNLVDDGIVGPKTWAVIRTALKLPAHLL